jgi:hypothetical protein
MRINVKNKTLLSALAALAAIYMGSSLAPAQNQPPPVAEAKGHACPNDESGLKSDTPPPRSGWLGEWGRLKGGCPVG